MTNKKVIIVGGGLAGLAATLRLSDCGYHVDLFSLTKVKRSHSVCAQGGINASLNIKEEEQDTPFIHAYDTIKAGDFLADQPPVLEMCLSAPHIIQFLDRCGCPFNRKSSGGLDSRRFGGTLYHRTLFCGASTGQQLMYTLDEQVRRQECLGRVVKYENHEFLRLILNDQGRACGIVFTNLFNNKIEVIKGDAVIIATGGLGVMYRKSTNSTFCTGAANGRLFMQGMYYANPEFIQIHPTAIPGKDKLRLISESVRGEGGRVWTWGNSDKFIQRPDGTTSSCGETGKPWYFLEDLYPAYGNLVSRDVGARAILEVCNLGLGIDGKMEVFLDVTHLSAITRKKLEAVLDIYEKFTGEDPNHVPMRVFPAVHYSMGGAWVDWPASDDADRETRFRHMTNLLGCFNCGESDFLYHGANRLGANSLLSSIYGGLVTGNEVVRFLSNRGSAECSSSLLRDELKIEQEKARNILLSKGKENIFVLHDELAQLMVSNVSVRRNNKDLEKTITEIYKIKEKFKKIGIHDSSQFANQTFQFARQFEPMVELALIITKGALLRNEFRGSHFKPEFPKRDDENWLKTTIVSYNSGEHPFRYKPVDTRHIDVELRDYTRVQEGVVQLKNVPDNIMLPI